MMSQLAKLEKAYAEEAISEREVLDKRAADGCSQRVAMDAV